MDTWWMPILGIAILLGIFLLILWAGFIVGRRLR